VPVPKRLCHPLTGCIPPVSRIFCRIGQEYAAAYKLQPVQPAGTAFSIAWCQLSAEQAAIHVVSYSSYTISHPLPPGPGPPLSAKPAAALCIPSTPPRPVFPQTFRSPTLQVASIHATTRLLTVSIWHKTDALALGSASTVELQPAGQQHMSSRELVAAQHVFVGAVHNHREATLHLRGVVAKQVTEAVGQMLLHTIAGFGAAIDKVDMTVDAALHSPAAFKSMLQAVQLRGTAVCIEWCQLAIEQRVSGVMSSGSGIISYRASDIAAVHLTMEILRPSTRMAALSHAIYPSLPGQIRFLPLPFHPPDPSSQPARVGFLHAATQPASAVLPCTTTS